MSELLPLYACNLTRRLLEVTKGKKLETIEESLSGLFEKWIQQGKMSEVVTFRLPDSSEITFYIDPYKTGAQVWAEVERPRHFLMNSHSVRILKVPDAIVLSTINGDFPLERLIGKDLGKNTEITGVVWDGSSYLNGNVIENVSINNFPSWDKEESLCVAYKGDTLLPIELRGTKGMMQVKTCKITQYLIDEGNADLGKSLDYIIEKRDNGSLEFCETDELDIEHVTTTKNNQTRAMNCEVIDDETIRIFLVIAEKRHLYVSEKSISIYDLPQVILEKDFVGRNLKDVAEINLPFIPSNTVISSAKRIELGDKQGLQITYSI